jgi:nucleotide-binding universal stress UspA family protein
MQLSKILLPIDFSERSVEAAHYAKALACQFHSELTIAHVFELGDAIGISQVGNTYSDWCDQRREETRRALQAFPSEEFQNMPLRRLLLEGDVAHAIVDLAHSEEMDIIVMPTHGYGRFRRFVVGSVTAKALHDADCPVLTGVHLPEMPSLGPTLFRNIVCAIEFDRAGERAFRWAADFAAEFHASLTLVHAIPAIDSGEMNYYDQGIPMMLRRLAEDRAAEFQSRCKTDAAVILEGGSVANVVCKTTSDIDGDLIVVARHENPGWMGRLRANTYAIVRDSPCPVVSV